MVMSLPSVYGNFSINMKGLIKRMFTAYIKSFKTLHDNCAVTFTADNLSDDELIKAVESLTKNDNIEAGMNPALGDRNIALQRLYEFYVDYFMNPVREDKEKRDVMKLIAPFVGCFKMVRSFDFQPFFCKYKNDSIACHNLMQYTQG